MNDVADIRDLHVVMYRVNMAYGERQVFSELSCGFPRGRISVILGGSGSGKSTILRLIGGLARPQSGRILVEGDDVTRLGERGLYAVRRKLGMMFQGGALLDSLNVFDNVAFPLREHSDFSEAEITDAVHERLAAVGLHDADGLLPGELSGGMVKRVALARALMQNPVIVLVDEAFSGLDPVSIKLIEALLVKINRQYGMTMILVSHHIPSTMRMADRVMLLLPDLIVEGTPAELAASNDVRVQRFLHEEAEDTETVLMHAQEFEAEIGPREPGGTQ